MEIKQTRNKRKASRARKIILDDMRAAKAFGSTDLREYRQALKEIDVLEHTASKVRTPSRIPTFVNNRNKIYQCPMCKKIFPNIPTQGLVECMICGYIDGEINFKEVENEKEV